MVGPSRQKNPKETKVLTNRGGSRILEGGGAWGVGDRIAVRSSQVCAPGGSEGMPLGAFEILDAFSCNLVHILSKN